MFSLSPSFTELKPPLPGSKPFPKERGLPALPRGPSRLSGPARTYKVTTIVTILSFFFLNSFLIMRSKAHVDYLFTGIPGTLTLLVSLSVMAATTGDTISNGTMCGKAEGV